MNIRRYIKLLAIVLVVLCIFLIIIFNYFIYPIKFSSYIQYYSNYYQVDESLIYAVIKAESGFNKNAVSAKGAVGLMQVLPTTADWIAQVIGIEEYNLFDAKTNIQFGTYYLKYLKNKFKDEKTAICAYNAGEGVVKGWLNNERYSSDKTTLKHIHYKETNSYLNKVNRYKKVYEIKLNW